MQPHTFLKISKNVTEHSITKHHHFNLFLLGVDTGNLGAPMSQLPSTQSQ